MDNKNKYPKRINVRWRWDGEDDSYITYQNPRNGNINIMNPVAASIFFYSDGHNSITDIIGKIMEEYEIGDEKMVADDVQKFIEELKKQHIVIMLDGEE
jgi:hypothetical protein